MNCKSVLSTTTWSPFIHAGLPASSKHFEHRYYLSQLHSRPRFCTRTLHSAHSFHFKQQQDLSLLVPSVLARSTAFTTTTLNTDYCFDLLIASPTLNSSYCHCIDLLVIIALP